MAGHDDTLDFKAHQLPHRVRGLLKCKVKNSSLVWLVPGRAGGKQQLKAEGEAESAALPLTKLS